ncbi:universal stress protein [Geodermatophilus sp. YIM 151500]|uniref:universal stress protein n=1 Tax=Geodermatophilus sp. YIM 151500 TaxID=2984531 RepID=UPI0021E3A271|nr:universal stress protein [Geodermatophilus sp. YIM 151500]MCV2487878.1 universal stress protein [Geodermatophilus sp. YIM 151500]
MAVGDEPQGGRREPATGSRRPRIVVGVDGSAGSRAALAHALRTAHSRGADLEVVAAYDVQLYWMGVYPVVNPPVDQLRALTEERTRRLVDGVVREVPGDGRSGPRVDVVVTAGPAVQALLDRAEGADLLVVGSRGRGALRSAALGSVALNCVMHAPCPVLTVHAGLRAAEAARSGGAVTASV